MGCGTGTFSLEFAKIKPEAMIVGVDISETAVKIAIKLAKTHSLDNVSFVVCDAEHLPFRSECFGVCFYSELLEHVLNPELVVKESARVLKKGGRLIASIPSANKCSFEWIISILCGGVTCIDEGRSLFYFDRCPRVGHPMFYRFTDRWILNNYFKHSVMIEKIEYHAHLFTPIIEAVYHAIKHSIHKKSELMLRSSARLLFEFLSRICSLDYVLFRKVPSGSNMIILGRKRTHREHDVAR